MQRSGRSTREWRDAGDGHGPIAETAIGPDGSVAAVVPSRLSRIRRASAIRIGAGQDCTRCTTLANSYRPFDDQWVYWVGTGKLLNEKHEDFFQTDLGW